MATLYITELREIGGDQDERVQIAKLPAISEQTVSISGTSTQSSAFANQTRFIRLHTDTACHILVGSNPTSTTDKLKLPANSTEYFEVNSGDKVAAIQAE